MPLTVSAATLVVLLETARRHGLPRAVALGVAFTLLLAPGFVLHERALELEAFGGLAVAANAWGMLAFVATVAGMALAPGLRPWPVLALVTIPGTVWAAGTFLALPWLALSALVDLPPMSWIFYAIAATGVWTSMVSRPETVHVTVGDDAGDELVRVTTGGTSDRPLRLVQITDPHLGAFRSEASLRALCERAVAAEPDLVLLTGDFFTMEGAREPDALARAFAPLSALRGRTFACLGNHDHEHPAEVRAALASAGIRLLVDDAELVETPAGPVQVVGLDHRWRGRGHAFVLARIPRVEGALRLVLLHDPSAFRHLPSGEADLTLSGHTHGGHVGLVSLGLAWTAVGALTRIPDHGLWGRGRDRLYVHRGSGHYGFPLRIGVPLEESVMHVHRAEGRAELAPCGHTG